MNVDLSKQQRIHIIGIGGAGMSALAEILAANGHIISGSDLKASRLTEKLKAQGISVNIGHCRENIAGGTRPDLIARSSAVGDSNVEVSSAREVSIPVCSRADLLAAVCKLRRSLAIAGTHGKTTTTSMLGLILREAGTEASFLVGGEVNEIGSGAHWGTGEWLIVEADESDGTFLQLQPEAAAVTSTETDHLDRYGSERAFQDAFQEFLDGVGERGGFRLIRTDETWGRNYAADCEGVQTFGLAEEADFRVVEVSQSRSTVSFTLLSPGGERVPVRLPLPGLHNALNATCAAACAWHLGVPLAASADTLSRFGGVARRYEFRGNTAGVSFVDDYAHLPGEVKFALHTAEAGDWQRIVCVFQPHRFSRIAHMHRAFADSFSPADLLLITDVYPAGEPPLPGISGKLVLDAVLESHPHQRAGWFPHRGDLLAYLCEELRPGDLCLTLNAGDLTTLPDEVMARLEA